MINSYNYLSFLLQRPKALMRPINNIVKYIATKIDFWQLHNRKARNVTNITRSEQNIYKYCGIGAPGGQTSKRNCMYLLTATDTRIPMDGISRFGSSRPRHEKKSFLSSTPIFPASPHCVSPTLRIRCVLIHHLGSDPNTLVNSSRRHLSRYAQHGWLKINCDQVQDDMHSPSLLMAPGRSADRSRRTSYSSHQRHVKFQKQSSLCFGQDQLNLSR